MTKEIQLQNGKVVLVDDEDYERANQYHWNIRLQDKILERVTMSKWHSGNKENINLAHFVLEVSLDHNQCVIFRNGNRLDHRKSNLKITTKREAHLRSRGNGNSTSKYKGVSWSKARKKWIAQVTIGGVRKNLGGFEEEDEAARVYNLAAVQAYGEHTFQNVIGQDNNCKEKNSEKNHQPRTIKKGKISKFRGVTKEINNTKWRAAIGKDRKHLGYFDSETQAAKAYNKAAKERYGPKAILNELNEVISDEFTSGE
jgi:hypothetical protein